MPNSPRSRAAMVVSGERPRSRAKVSCNNAISIDAHQTALSRRRPTALTRKARTSRATVMGRRRPSPPVPRRCLATSQPTRADLAVAFRWADHDLDITTQSQQNADEPVGREAAQFAVEQKGNLR